MRFGEVFEGFLPARRLQGEYLRAERPRNRNGRPDDRPQYRLGDSISIRVERISRNEGKVELTPA